MTENQLRAELIETAKASIERGINHGSAGNVSVRWHRGGSDGLLITPSALPGDQYTPDDIVWMSIVPVSGAQTRPSAQPMIDGLRRPSSEWRFHHDLYARRPEVNAVVHTHAPYCAALSCLPKVQQGGIPAFHYMVAAAGGADIRCAPYAAFGTQALSDLALTALEDRRACLLAHHGMIAVGQTLSAALALAVEVEWLARTYAQTLQLGTPDILSAQQMDEVLRKFADYRS
jgi:L-fuculose-phosphate aldolase